MTGDLVAEGWLREALAADRARRELGDDVLTEAELPATRALPDPYGPDHLVFGDVPRVKSPFS